MNTCHELIVPPKSGRAFTVSRGRTVRITDTQGRQPGDLVAFKAADPAVKLSQARTRVENCTVALKQGDRLWTNTLPPEVMLTITDDSFGAHDLLYPPCCRYALEKRFDVSGDGCLENLASALSGWDIESHQIPDPLNLFFQVSVDAAGGMAVQAPISEAGCSIDLRAEMDCLVAVSTCAVPFQGTEPSEYHIQVYER
jgi:uncharacterized protein YcgI (DUF1989 family)